MNKKLQTYRDTIEEKNGIFELSFREYCRDNYEDFSTNYEDSFIYVLWRTIMSLSLIYVMNVFYYEFRPGYYHEQVYHFELHRFMNIYLIMFKDCSRSFWKTCSFELYHFQIYNKQKFSFISVFDRKFNTELTKFKLIN